MSWLMREKFKSTSIRAAHGVFPFLGVLMVSAAFASAARAESSAFSPPTAETFTGKQALEDAFLRLQLDYRNSRDALDLLGIGRNALVTYWQWSFPGDTAPPSIEFHFEAGQYVVIDIASGVLLTYLRHGEYWVTPGPPEASAPEVPKPKSAAITEDNAGKLAAEWLAKFAPTATWTADGPVYKDRFDVAPEDLLGAWWEFSFERTHGGYPVRGANAEIALNAETGELMRFALPLFAPPAGLAIYFPPENARIKADDYLQQDPQCLEGLLAVKPNLPEQQIIDTGDNFSVRGGLVGRRAQRKAEKKENKQLKTNKSNPSDPAPGEEFPIIAPIAPVLGPGEVQLALVAGFRVLEAAQLATN
jgi:hypothetical protein